ncbi:DUF4911 domain-containing protein [bacterium]|nr:DUF4911 domain-containing protein [bacterium]
MTPPTVPPPPLDESEHLIPAEAIAESEDSHTIFREVSRPSIVFFQALFESYEGLGTVRTEDKTRGLITIHSTPSQKSDLIHLLSSLSREYSREELPWRYGVQG